MLTITVPEDKKEWLKLKAQDLTSTEVPALFNCSPYTTEFELWHRKKNQDIMELDPNERMTWGNRLQDSIAFGIAEDNDWDIRRKIEYLRDDKSRIGSSFDFEIINPRAILEIKNVDSLVYKEEWIEGLNGEIEAPPHIELQVQHQMLVSGIPLAFLGVLIGGNRVVTLKREFNKFAGDVIKEKAKAFWKSIDEGREPKPDFSRDLNIISKIYGYADPNKIMDASHEPRILELASAYKIASETQSAADKEKSKIKAELLTLIKDSEKVLGDGFSISSRMMAPTWVDSYERKGYRDFRIYWKKQKGDK